MSYIIKPTFNNLKNSVTFRSDSLNAFAADEIQDNFNNYQDKFNVFGWMKLNDDRKFVLNRLSGNPLMWQAHNSCSWDPIGGLTMGSETMAPCNVKINAEQCYDEMFKSCFSHFLRWDGNGPIQLDADGQAVINQMVKVIGQNSVLGILMTLTAGKKFNSSDVNFKEKTPDNIKELFGKTAGSCEGWLELLDRLSITHKNANIEGIFKPDDFEGKKYVGNVLELLDNIKEESPAALETCMDEGMIPGQGDASTDTHNLLLVSSSIHKAVALFYKTYCQPQNCVNPNPRITRENCGTATRQFWVYYLDGVAVIPINYPNHYTQYLTGELHFAYLTTSRNINLGGSFASLPEVGDGNAGIMIQKGNNAYDYGKYYFLAHQLLGTKVADMELIAGAQVYAEYTK